MNNNDNNYIYDEPKICLIDCEAEVATILREDHYTVFRGTWGPIETIDRTRHPGDVLCTEAVRLPINVHEYSVFIIDLLNADNISYSPEDNKIQGVSCHGKWIAKVTRPQDIYDPRPYGAIRFKKIIEEQMRSTIIIIFASDHVKQDYTFQPIGVNDVNSHHFTDVSIYSFYPRSHRIKSKMGTNICLVNSRLTQLFIKYFNDAKYFCYYAGEVKRNKDTDKYYLEKPNTYPDESNVDDIITPLALNDENNLISWAHTENNLHFLFFPNPDNKPGFIKDLFLDYLPDILPNIFQDSAQHTWLADDSYLLPGQQECIRQKQLIKESYNNQIMEIDNKIEEIKEKYKYLHELITETGAVLVEAVEQYLRWIGFDKAQIKNMDRLEPGRKEEDLQVWLSDDSLIVIEVKGLNGTSTDENCRQVGKYRHRRMRENNIFNVSAIYIVNHQRNKRPQNRSNPPFDAKKIADAVEEERGLLTTYRLFQLYFEIEEGIITKEEARKALNQTGLINFINSNLLSLGRPYKIHQEGQVALLDLGNITLKIGDLLFSKEDRWKSNRILSLQLDGKVVEEVTAQKVGIKLEHPVKVTTDLYAKKPFEQS